MAMEAVHTSVLLAECLEYLAPETDRPLMVDGTLGEGGHSEAFLEKFPNLRVIGVDADVRIQARARERLAPFGDRICFSRMADSLPITLKMKRTRHHSS